MIHFTTCGCEHVCFRDVDMKSNIKKRKEKKRHRQISMSIGIYVLHIHIFFISRLIVDS